MGLATIVPHSRRGYTEIHKISKFKIQRFKNVKINKEMYGHPDAVRTQRPDGLYFFVNFDVYKWDLNQTWGFCKASSARYDYMDQ